MGSTVGISGPITTHLGSGNAKSLVTEGGSGTHSSACIQEASHSGFVSGTGSVEAVPKAPLQATVHAQVQAEYQPGQAFLPQQGTHQAPRREDRSLRLNPLVRALFANNAFFGTSSNGSGAGAAATSAQRKLDKGIITLEEYEEIMKADRALVDRTNTLHFLCFCHGAFKRILIILLPAW
jgi:hypothetical protein